MLLHQCQRNRIYLQVPALLKKIFAGGLTLWMAHFLTFIGPYKDDLPVNDLNCPFWSASLSPKHPWVLNLGKDITFIFIKIYVVNINKSFYRQENWTPNAFRPKKGTHIFCLWPISYRWKSCEAQGYSHMDLLLVAPVLVKRLAWGVKLSAKLQESLFLFVGIPIKMEIYEISLTLKCPLWSLIRTKLFRLSVLLRKDIMPTVRSVKL